MSFENFQGSTHAISSIFNPLEGLEKESEYQKRNFVLPGLLIGLITVISILCVLWFSQNNRETLEENLEKRMNTVVVSQGAIVENLLSGQFNAGLEHVNSDMLRLVLSEKANLESSPLLPRLQDSLQAFREKYKFHSTFVLNKDSLTVLGSSANDQQTAAAFRSAVPEMIQKGRSLLKPLRLENDRLFLDVLHPILEFQKQAQNNNYTPVGALVTTTDVTALFSKALKSSLDEDSADSLLLFSIGQETYVLNEQSMVLEIRADFDQDDLDQFLGPSLLTSKQMSYRKFTPVEGTEWFILRKANESVILKEVARFNLFGGLLATLFVIALSGIMMVFWIRQRSQRHKDLANQYKLFAQKLHFQNRFIDTINKAIPDAVMLKDSTGKIVYTNPAADEIFELNPDSNEELSQNAVFDTESLKWVKQLDARALKKSENITENLVLKKGKEPKHLVISSIPFLEGEGNFEETNNILNVARDITEVVKSQNERIRMVERTVMTLVSVIERRDPYLKGHSKQLAKLAMAIGKKMNLSGEEIRYLNYAGSLSQIGKTFISQEILTKSERLNADEIAEMNKHIQYTIETVKELGMPKQVIEGLSHMYERLDGSGYPEGLSGDQISKEGRILAVADIIVARLSERSYRKAITLETALQVLEDNKNKYDYEVIQHLSKLCNTEEIDHILSTNGSTS